VRSPGSCVRCSQPLDTESESGLCPTCRIAIDTPHSSAESPAPSAGDKTASFRLAVSKNEPATGSPAGTATRTANAPSIDLHAAPSPASGTLPDPRRWSSPSADTQVDLPAPLGYELIRELDSGGMGVVYLARDHVTDRLVAMKFLRGGLGGGSAADRFLVEVRALAALNHPNIVRVLSTDFYRPDPFFTMDYEAGGTLADVVKKHGPLSAAEAVALMRPVVGAVAAAHAENILHRDLKPSNILLGADGTPKVSDFGLAKRTDKDDGITINSVSLGTPGYMPPEQISRRKGVVGPASDVYGLGATLYHLLTGQPPFRGGTAAETMNQVLTDLPQRPRALRPEVPLALEAVVMKCLEKNPADRYPSAEALANDLDRFQVGLLPDAPLLTRPRRAWHWLRRNRVRVAGAALALIAVVVLGAIFWPGPEPAEQLRRALKAGKSYTVVENGPPRYYRWRLGGSAFGVSTLAEKACRYESFHHSMLELGPEDPGIDRYRVTFDLYHAAPLGGEESAKEDLSFVAFYWGHAEQPAPDGRPIHTFFALSYSDTKPDFGPDTKRVHTFRPRSVALILQPKGDPVPILRQLDKPHPFRDAGPQKDAKWRSFRIDITPDRVRVAWKNDQTGDYQLLADLAGEEIQTAYAKSQPRLPPGAVIPAWSPRMPMGIWSSRAVVSVKNFVLTPLNPERE
jgi:hypothetical protein